MGENSKIEWCDHTFNPWIGCQKVSPGCDHCYAEALMDKRYGKVQWGPHGERKRTSEANWKLPLRWAKYSHSKFYAWETARASLFDGADDSVMIAKGWVKPHRPRVFCASLADWLDNQAPQQWRVDLAHLVAATPELDWLLLTKRIENFRKLSPWGSEIPFPTNVWLGTTCEDQEHYDKRWAILSKIPATVRFISHEPAIGPLIDLYAMSDLPDWLIMGGESGAGARTMQEEWARHTRDYCKQTRVPFFFKQMTGKKPIPDDLLVRQLPRAA